LQKQSAASIVDISSNHQNRTKISRPFIKWIYAHLPTSEKYNVPQSGDTPGKKGRTAAFPLYRLLFFTLTNYGKERKKFSFFISVRLAAIQAGETLLPYPIPIETNPNLFLKGSC